MTLDPFGHQSTLLAHDPTFVGIGRGALVLAALGEVDGGEIVLEHQI